MFCNQKRLRAQVLCATDISAEIIGHRNVQHDIVINALVCDREGLESQKSKFLNVSLSRQNNSVDIFAFLITRK